MEKMKTALVTGGSRGLGADMALALSAEGYRVAVNYRQSLEDARHVAARAVGPEVVLMRGDVSSASDVSVMAGLVTRLWGRLDLLVNNAGVSRDALILRTSEESWDEHVAVNLKGALNMTRALARTMKSSGGGHVVNISSRSGTRGKAGQAAYSASKGALVGLTLTAARELARSGIRVNAVLPGYMATDMGRAAGAAMAGARGQSLMGTLGHPADLSSFILWLAQTSTVTGQVFSIDSRIG